MNNKNYDLQITCPPFPAFISSGKCFLKPGEVHVERIFPVFVLMFITEGIVYFKEGETSYELKKGEWFIQTPGIKHFGDKKSNMPAAFWWIHFMPVCKWDIIESGSEEQKSKNSINIIDSGEGIRLPKYEFRLPMRRTYPHEMWEVQLENVNNAYLSVSNLANAQAEFDKIIGLMAGVNTESCLSPCEALAVKVEEYIKQNYRRNITVKNISEYFHFSCDYITRCFKHKFAITPSEFIIRLRMDYCRNALLNTNKPVQEIAEEAGYSNIAVFSRTFHRFTGKSPLKYRVSSRGCK